jgi:hypothetical protein
VDAMTHLVLSVDGNSTGALLIGNNERWNPHHALAAPRSGVVVYFYMDCDYIPRAIFDFSRSAVFPRTFAFVSFPKALFHMPFYLSCMLYLQKQII